MENLDEYIGNYLQLVGYKPEETALFVSLLKKGPMTILQLSRETGVERTKIYTIVENLVQDGLLDEQLDYKKKYVRACDVSKVELILKDKIDALQSLTTNFNSFISKVNLLGGSVSTTGVKFYRGVDGIKQQLWNGLSANGEIRSYSYRDFIEIVGYRFFDSWAIEFERRKLRNLDLRSDEFLSSARELLKTAKMHPFKGDIVRYIPSSVLNIQLAVDMYNDTISLYNWNKGEIFGVEIVNKQFAELQKEIYMNYWKMGIPATDVNKIEFPGVPTN